MAQHNYPVVGLVGRKRVGKDTFADVLVEHFGFTRVSLAGPLKEAALRLNPIVGPSPIPGGLGSEYRRLQDVVEAIGWERAKDFVPGVRETLQRLGTDAIRAIDDSFWVRAARETILATGGPVVITDVRFPNEGDMIRELGGYLVRIERAGVLDGDLHPSETAMDDYVTDWGVNNDGDLQYFQDVARYIGARIAR